jgi:predicted secreted Zn-dependent protease
VVIFDAATYAMEALAVGLVDPHDANAALDRKRLSRRLGTMRRNMESAVDKFPWGEHSFGATVESITT